MKRRLLYSLLIGLVLLIISLFYKTGRLEPMPYLNGGCNGGICGVVAIPPGGLTASTSLAKRGLPLPVVSLNTDEDSPSNYYKNLNVINTLIDFALFTIIAFCLLSLVNHINKPLKPKSHSN